MSEELEQQVADPALETAQSEAAPGATEAAETTAVETDEQKNERVEREARERSEKRVSGFQKRIDDLTAEKHAERRRADEALSQNARMLALLEQGRAPASQAASQGEPTRDQFDTYEDFVVARAEYRAEAKAAALIERSNKSQAETTAKTTADNEIARVNREWEARQREVQAKIPDYVEVMSNAEVAVPGHVIQMIMRLPDGPNIAYAMQKSPELAKQFFDNPPHMHGYLLGQLSSTLKGSTKSNAPAPGKPARSTAAPSDGPPSDPELYYAWAKKHLK